MTAAPDLERIKARIRQLREMTAARGCTEAEARAAARKVAELMAAYKLTDQDIDMGVADAAMYEAKQKRNAWIGIEGNAWDGSGDELYEGIRNEPGPLADAGAIRAVESLDASAESVG